MSDKVINFSERFGLIDEQLQPKVIAEMNDYQFKLVRLQGDFIWHDHKETDEMFIAPKGVEHKLYAQKEVKVLLIEPRGTLNTGHEGGERAAEKDVWI